MSHNDPILRGPFLFDGHVHVYPCFDDEAVLDAAEANAQALCGGIGVLGLVELSWCHVFRRWREAGRVGARWTLRSAAEPWVLLAERDGRVRLVVLAGRQIVTQGRLGVLAIGADREYPDARPFEESVEAAQAAGTLTIAGFGVGKWLGPRGRIVDAAIARARPGELAVGDIGIRPGRWGLPRQFTAAEAKGLSIVPGSDPLVFRACQTMPCNFGVVVEGAFAQDQIGRGLIDAVRHLGPHGRKVGRYEGLPQAVYLQARLRMARWVLRQQGLDT